MVFEALLELAQAGWYYFRDIFPERLSRPHFNFITVHYMYMIGMTLAGAIMLWPPTPHLMDFTDAIFFAAGSATQSGLNTIDINTLYTYQQVVFMLIACVCNPIFINTAVVFMRLYWFEKRFKHVIQQQKEQRRSRARTMSRRKSQMREDTDLSRLEMGVAGRHIRVLHETTKPNGMSGSTAKTAQAEREFAEKLGLNPFAESVSTTNPEGSNKSSSHGDDLSPDERQGLIHDGEGEPQSPRATYLGLGPLRREIAFADEVQSPSMGDAQTPPIIAIGHAQEHVGSDKHIQFIERQQRNAHSEGGTLRIPGPRDFDRGVLPKELELSDDELERPLTRDPISPAYSRRARAIAVNAVGRDDQLNADDHPRRGITIDEAEHPGHRAKEADDEEDHPITTAFSNTLSKVRSGMSHRRTGSRGLHVADRGRSTTMNSAYSTSKAEKAMPYLSYQATIGRNSAFLGLSQEQREELGGIEYRSLVLLAKILIGYFVGFHLLGMVCLLPWIMAVDGPWRPLIVADGQNPAWWGVFTPASMFNDLGFTLTPDSMNSFQQATLPLLLGSFLIIIGNTGFPCMLRFIIWILSKVVRKETETWHELHFLLDHPRRCFTLLFPSRATWWLFWILVILNGVDLLFFIVLDLHDEVVTSIPAGYRVLNGWFQATSTRTAGFSCVNLAALHPGIQVSYLVMMYISVFPIAISIRRTNVYEEKSLGIWGGEDEGEGGEQQSYVGQHLRRQLSFDLWYVFLGWFIICIVEGPRLANTNEYAFTMFSVLFEIVSAYGTVGMSLGYPGINASFSAEFKALSKLVIVAMMLRGRHRGLPYALDRAILLPSENLHLKDDEATLPRRSSMIERTGTWEDGDLDSNGLPTQYTSPTAHAMAAGAGGERSPERFRHPQRRRSSVMTTGSGGETAPKRRHERRRSLGVVLASGLSAGPTLSKHE